MPLLDLDDRTPRELNLTRLADELARAFARHADTADRAGEIALDAIEILKASPYPALTIPDRYGGSGATLHEFTLTQECLGRADASLALIAAMNGHLLGSAGESGAWPDHLYARVAHAAVTRGALTNALASEPELGSPSRGGLPRTLAVREHAGWRVTGRKTWSTGAPVLDFLIVTATNENRAARFLIPADAPGVHVEPTWGDGLALRGSGSHDVVLDGVFVADDHEIPPGPPSPSGSAWFWAAVAGTYLGVARGALDALAQYTRERVPTALGQPIATLPNVQQQVGQMTLELHAARAYLHRVTRAWSSRPHDRDALLPLLAGAKSLATNAAVHVTDVATRVAGGAALGRALPLERHFRDARAGLMHPPSDDTALQLLGRAALDADG